MRLRPICRILCLPLVAYILAAVLLWFSLDPRPKWVLRAEEALNPVGFAPDGPFLVTRAQPDWLYGNPAFSTGPIRVWDVRTGCEHHRLLEDATDLGHMELAPDGKRLAVMRPRRVAIVEMASGSELATWPLEHPFCGMTWSPDGSSLALVEALAYYEPASIPGDPADSIQARRLQFNHRFQPGWPFPGNG